MAWQVSENTALAGDLSSGPSTHIAAYNPHNGLQPSSTPVSGDPVQSSDLSKQQTYTLHIHICKTLIHKKRVNHFFKSDAVNTSVLQRISGSS